MLYEIGLTIILIWRHQREIDRINNVLLLVSKDHQTFYNNVRSYSICLEDYQNHYMHCTQKLNLTLQNLLNLEKFPKKNMQQLSLYFLFLFITFILLLNLQKMNSIDPNLLSLMQALQILINQLMYMSFVLHLNPVQVILIISKDQNLIISELLEAKFLLIFY